MPGFWDQLETTVRRANSQSRANEEASSLLFFQLIVVAVAAGWRYRSWWVGVAVLVGVAMTLFIPILRFVSSTFLAAGCAALLWYATAYFGYTTAAWVVAALVFLGLASGNLGGLQHLDDTSPPRK